MRRFGDLFQLVLRYRLNLAGNIVFNALGSVLSLFTFLAIVPFLRILFRTDGGADPANATPTGDGAEALFARQGYDGTSLRQIAQGAGIKEPGLYNHFSGKQALPRSAECAIGNFAFHFHVFFYPF